MALLYGVKGLFLRAGPWSCWCPAQLSLLFQKCLSISSPSSDTMLAGSLPVNASSLHSQGAFLFRWEWLSSSDFPDLPVTSSVVHCVLAFKQTSCLSEVLVFLYWKDSRDGSLVLFELQKDKSRNNLHHE